MKISKRDKAFLAAGGCALAIAGLYLYVLTPLQEHYLATRSEIAVKTKLLSRYRHLWDGRNTVEKKLKKALAQGKVLDKRFLTGENESLAAAELQKMLEGLAAQSDVAISSSKVIGYKKAGSFETLSIQVGARSTLRNLRDFLYLIENAAKHLSVTEINLRAIRFRGVEKLEARMKVSGFMRVASPKGLNP